MHCQQKTLKNCVMICGTKTKKKTSNPELPGSLVLLMQ